MIPRVVITGAPASGKTEFIQWLRPKEQFSDFVIFDELARTLLIENPNYRQHWHEFHREIYERQIQREILHKGRPFITDRGTIDAFAFHPETMAAVGTSLEREYNRYSLVIQLGSAAALGEDYYRTDAERRESADDAMEIERALKRVWSGHPSYRFVPPRELIKDKFVSALQILSQELAEIVNIW
jgi:predicted ATPase